MEPNEPPSPQVQLSPRLEDRSALDSPNGSTITEADPEISNDYTSISEGEECSKHTTARSLGLVTLRSTNPGPSRRPSSWFSSLISAANQGSGILPSPRTILPPLGPNIIEHGHITREEFPRTESLSTPRNDPLYLAKSIFRSYSRHGSHEPRVLQTTIASRSVTRAVIEQGVRKNPTANDRLLEIHRRDGQNHSQGHSKSAHTRNTCQEPIRSRSQEGSDPSGVHVQLHIKNELGDLKLPNIPDLMSPTIGTSSHLSEQISELTSRLEVRTQMRLSDPATEHAAWSTSPLLLNIEADSHELKKAQKAKFDRSFDEIFEENLSSGRDYLSAYETLKSRFRLEGSMSSVIEKKIKADEDLDTRDEEGYTLLHKIIAADDQVSARRLLRQHPMVDQKDSWQITPLHYAVQDGQLGMVKLLLRAGADLEVRNSQDRTPIFEAVKRGDGAMVKFLLRQGAEPRVVMRHSGQTLLHEAIGLNIKLQDRQLIVTEIINAGADIDVLNSKSQSPKDLILEDYYKIGSSLINILENEEIGDGRVPIFRLTDFLAKKGDNIQGSYCRLFPTCSIHSNPEGVLVDNGGRPPVFLLASTVPNTRKSLWQFLATQTSTGFLRCLGILIDSQRFSLMFSIPPNLSEIRGLRSWLFSHRPKPLDLLQLARDTVSLVLAVHEAGLVHENICPETILILSTSDSHSISPFLVGFERLRSAADAVPSLSGGSNDQNLYKHSTLHDLLIEIPYLVQHDIYSLGVCLLEIGLWTSFIGPDQEKALDVGPWYDMTAKLNEMQDTTTMHQILINEAQEKLPHLINTCYADCVERCLQSPVENSSVGYGPKFFENILNDLTF